MRSKKNIMTNRLSLFFILFYCSFNLFAIPRVPEDYKTNEKIKLKNEKEVNMSQKVSLAIRLYEFKKYRKLNKFLLLHQKEFLSRYPYYYYHLTSMQYFKEKNCKDAFSFATQGLRYRSGSSDLLAIYLKCYQGLLLDKEIKKHIYYEMFFFDNFELIDRESILLDYYFFQKEQYGDLIKEENQNKAKGEKNKILPYDKFLLSKVANHPEYVKALIVLSDSLLKEGHWNKVFELLGRYYPEQLKSIKLRLNFAKSIILSNQLKKAEKLNFLNIKKAQDILHSIVNSEDMSGLVMKDAYSFLIKSYLLIDDINSAKKTLTEAKSKLSLDNLSYLNELLLSYIGNE